MGGNTRDGSTPFSRITNPVIGAIQCLGVGGQILRRPDTARASLTPQQGADRGCLHAAQLRQQLAVGAGMLSEVVTAPRPSAVAAANWT